jgi:hypothetical protein
MTAVFSSVLQVSGPYPSLALPANDGPPGSVPQATGLDRTETRRPVVSRKRKRRIGFGDLKAHRKRTKL